MTAHRIPVLGTQPPFVGWLLGYFEGHLQPGYGQTFEVPGPAPLPPAVFDPLEPSDLRSGFPIPRRCVFKVVHFGRRDARRSMKAMVAQNTEALLLMLNGARPPLHSILPRFSMDPIDVWGQRERPTDAAREAALVQGIERFRQAAEIFNPRAMVDWFAGGSEVLEARLLQEIPRVRSYSIGYSLHDLSMVPIGEIRPASEEMINIIGTDRAREMIRQAFEEGRFAGLADHYQARPETPTPEAMTEELATRTLQELETRLEERAARIEARRSTLRDFEDARPPDRPPRPADEVHRALHRNCRCMTAYGSTPLASEEAADAVAQVRRRDTRPLRDFLEEVEQILQPDVSERHADEVARHGSPGEEVKGEPLAPPPTFLPPLD